MCPHIFLTVDVNTDTIVGTETHRPCNSLTEAGLAETWSKRESVEQENKVFVVSEKAEPLWTGAHPVHAFDCCHYAESFLFQARQT